MLFDFDFTFNQYSILCNLLLKTDYHIITVEDFLRSDREERKFVILRHDIDRKIGNALKIANIDKNLNIKSSFYFRFPFTFDVTIIKKIHSMGHEIGYHYEVLSKTKGNYDKAIHLFERELMEFRKICEINTICMHGNPLSRYNNIDLWSKYNFNKYGILGDAMLSFKDIPYFSDTGRNWGRRFNLRDNIPSRDQPNFIKTTNDFMKYIIETNPDHIYITTHPERWSSNFIEWIYNFILDMIFNIGKTLLKMIR